MEPTETSIDPTQDIQPPLASRELPAPPGLLQLPHSAHCLVCGKSNPRGLKLDLHVEPQSGLVRTEFTPTIDDTGFERIVHGGMLASVLDEAMVWAATWRGKRFCVCGEMTVRFRESAVVNEPLTVTAKVDQARTKLVLTSGQVQRPDGKILATASGKYIPLDDRRNAD